MRRKIFKFRRNKKSILTVLLVLALIFIVLGILLIAILSKENKILLKDYIEAFFAMIKENKLNYKDSIKTVLSTNFISIVLVWILGISLIGIPLVLIYFLFKALTIGMSFSSIIYFYKGKGVLLSIIYIIPSIINLGIFIILCYNSIKMSKYLYRILFLKEHINKNIMKRYINVLLILLVFIIGSSFIEVFIIPNIMRLFL